MVMAKLEGRVFALLRRFPGARRFPFDQDRAGQPLGADRMNRPPAARMKPGLSRANSVDPRFAHLATGTMKPRAGGVIRHPEMSEEPDDGPDEGE